MVRENIYRELLRIKCVVIMEHILEDLNKAENRTTINSPIILLGLCLTVLNKHTIEIPNHP